MGHDLIYSLRLFRKSPGLAAVAILSLELGIGLNLTAFGGFESLFLRGGPGSHLWAGRSNRILCELSGSVQHPCRFHDGGIQPDAVLAGARRRSREDLRAMAGEYFEMLGVRPILGRGFIEEEKRPERDAHVAVLSYPFWKQRFGGSRQGTTKESV